MNKPFIFITGVICGIFIFAITNYITDSIREALINNSSQPVITNQVESFEDQAQPNAEDNGTGQLPNERSTNYVRFWQSNGIKFKDVGENGIEKTYVWNASLKKWIDTGCVGIIGD